MKERFQKKAEGIIQGIEGLRRIGSLICWRNRGCCDEEIGVFEGVGGVKFACF